MMRIFAGLGLRGAGVALAIAAALATPSSPARADASQLCRAGSNLVLAPMDVGLAPFIAGKDELYGLREIDDPWALKAVAVLPGYVMLLGLQAGGAAFREIAAVIELPMGMVTLFRQGAQPPLFRSQDEAWALYSDDYGPCPVRFGTSYNTINEG